jgi:hypothetical protein
MATEPLTTGTISVEWPVQAARDKAAAQVADANAKFAELQEAYNNSPEQKLARDRDYLNRLQNDPHHLGLKLVSTAAQNEEAVLRARIAAAERNLESERSARAIVGEKIDLPGMIETTTEGQLPMREMISVVDDLRALGLNDVCIGEALNGAHYSTAIIAEGKALFDARMSDSEWVKKLSAGDLATRREHTLLHILLNATPTDATRE